MLESILIAAEQTAILFVLMGFGYLARRLGMLSGATVRKLTAIVVNFTTPGLILTSFQCPFDAARLPGLGWSLAMALGWFALAIVIERAFFRHRDDVEHKELRWSVIFSNCGFMGLPLEYALFGNDGVFYGVAAIAVWNFIGWTYGVAIFRPLDGRRDLIRGMLNPANVAAVVALVLFFLPWRLPKLLAEPIRMVGDMNTPLPMLILGYFLGGAKFGPVLRSARAFGMLFSRHFAVPIALALLLAVACPFISSELKLMAVVPAACPIGVLLTVFSVRYGGDAEYATALVAVSTVLSILTIPLVVGFARMVF